MLTKALRFFDNVAWKLAGAMGRTTEAFVDIETWQDDFTLVCRDGALLSLIDIQGYRAMTHADSNEFAQLVDTLRLALAPNFATQGYRFQFTFHRDPSPSAVDQLLDTHIGPIRNAAIRNGLEMGDVLDAQARVMRPVIAAEHTTLAIWTLPTALSWAERKGNVADQQRRGAKRPRIIHGQHSDHALLSLVTLHTTLREAFIRALPAYKIEVLDVFAALRRMRQTVDLDVCAEDWDAKLLPHGALVPASGMPSDDASFAAPPTIAEQVAPTPIEAIDSQLIRIGRRTYAMTYMALAPDNLRSFDALVGLVGNMPWRVAWMLTPGAHAQMPAQFRRMIASLAVGQPHIRDAYEGISSDPGAQLLALQASFATWVEGEDTADTRDRVRVQAARLVRALQTWGNAQADNYVGHPVHAFFETVPGSVRRTRSPAAIAPLDEALHLLPISRAGSAWAQGSTIMRTSDGRVYPIDQFSPRQTSWVNLIFASMGGGKSVLANALNRALATSPTSESLPYITVLDVGPASSGIVSLIAESLPPSLRHQAVHRRLRMITEDAINPLDTGYLGLRRPLPTRKTWLLALLRLFCLPADSDRPHERVDSMLEALIELAYTQYAAKEARRYAPNVMPEIDAAIKRHGLSGEIKPNTSWWELVDVFWHLHVQLRIDDALYLAERAQTMAAPTLEDLVRICTSEVLRTPYSGTVASTSEPVYQYVQQSLATAIRQYPNLASATRVFLQAKIVALDLEPVMPAGTADSARQGTIMAMVARELGASRYFTHPTDFDSLPESVLPSLYRDHHRLDAQRILEQPKRIQYDEFHRFSHPIIQDQVLTDARMGRRTKVDITLISQSILDFNPVLVSVASTVWIAAGANPDAQVMPKGATSPVRMAQLIQSTFGLSESALIALKRLPKPNAKGAHYIASFRLDSGQTYAHEVVLTLPPEEIWAYSTTAEDRALRDRLYGLVGPQAARALLCATFPGGSAVQVIEQRRSELGAIPRDQASATVVEQIVSEMLGRTH